MVRAEYDEIVERLDAEATRREEVQEAIEEALRARIPPLKPAPVPQSVVAEEPEALFDSRRSYAAQLFDYKRHRNGNGHDDILENVQLQILIAAAGPTGGNRLEQDSEWR